MRDDMHWNLAHPAPVRSLVIKAFAECSILKRGNNLLRDASGQVNPTLTFEHQRQVARRPAQIRGEQ